MFSDSERKNIRSFGPKNTQVVKKHTTLESKLLGLVFFLASKLSFFLGWSVFFPRSVGNFAAALSKVFSNCPQELFCGKIILFNGHSM